MKKVGLFVLCLILLFSLFACDSVPESSGDIIYQSDNVLVRKLPRGDVVRSVTGFYMDMTVDNALEISPIVLSATVKNVTPVAISYQYNEMDLVSNSTLLTLENVKVLSDRENLLTEQRDEWTALISYSEYSYDGMLPLFEEGEEFVLFCSLSVSDKKIPTEPWGYVDLLAYLHYECIVERVGDFYLVPGMFSDNFPEIKTVRQEFLLADRNQLEEDVEFVDAWHSLRPGDYDPEHPVLKRLCQNSKDPEFAFEVLTEIQKYKSFNDFYPMIESWKLVPCDLFAEFISNY